MDSPEKNQLQLLIAEYWATWLGIELNYDKREDPRSATRHLGFFIDLNHKFVTITMKHRDRVVAHFNSNASDPKRGLYPGKEHTEVARVANLGEHCISRGKTLCYFHL